MKTTENGDLIVYEGRIAGVGFGHYKFRPDRLKNAELVVVPMPENEYDADAIALKKINGTLAHHVGYIPRDETWRIHEILNEGKRVKAKCHFVDLAASAGDQAHVQVWVVGSAATLTREKSRKTIARVKRLRGLNPPGRRLLILK